MIYNVSSAWGWTRVGLRVLAAAIREQLTEDLRKPWYRGHPNPIRGQCYFASEAAFYLLGEYRSGWVPQRVRLRFEGHSEVHYYLRHQDTKAIFDITADQYDVEPPYEYGKGCGFVTKVPSKGAKKILDRVQDHLNHFYPYTPPCPNPNVG